MRHARRIISRLKTSLAPSDKLEEDEASVELKIYIELEEEEIFARSSIDDSDPMTARLHEDACPSHHLGDGLDAITLN